MSLSDLISHAALTTGCAGLLYAGTVTTAALTALTARTPARRRAAQAVLKILVRRG